MFWKRPLLFCYGNDAYIPKDKGNYDSEWEKVENGISKCVCEGADECTGEDRNCCKLLEELVKVVGFLNTVQLEMHPNSKTKGDCNSASSAVASETTCTSGPEKNGTNVCMYVVHTYGNKKVMVKVECSPVKGTDETRNGCNYKKLIHEPIGTNGAGAKAAGDNGFRLGNVVYNSNGTGAPQGTINYYTNGGDNPNKFKPLVSVSAYFYNHDKEYRDPLLVVLEFKNNGDSASGKVCEYYRLKTREESNMEWAIDTEACEIVKKNGKCDELVNYLDNILSQHSKHLQIIIDKRPVIQLYKLNDKTSKCNESATYKNPDEGLKCLREWDYKIMKCEMKGIEELNKTCEKVKKIINHGIKDKPYYYLPTKTCYKGKIYGNGAQSGSSEPKETSIVVKELNCEDLAFHGYKCYMHDLLEVEGKEQIGGLRFFLWDNRGGASVPGSSTSTCGTTTNTGASCPAAGSTDTNYRELCLYVPSSGASTGEQTILRQVDLISVH